MGKLNNVAVVATKKDSILELTAAAAQYGEHVCLLFAGDEALALNAEKAYCFGSLENASFAAMVPAIVSCLKGLGPDLVLVELSKNGRLAAAQIAAAFETSVLTDSSAFCVEDGKVVSKRMVYGGSAIKTESAAGTAVACFSIGEFAAEAETPAGKVVKVDVPANEGIKLLGKAPKTVQAVNLNAATKVVGVGRGFPTEESLSLARDLAAVLGAEMACTRPIAEEEKWMPTERYIGVSGAMIKPALYVCAGVSGQIQHTVGVNNSGMIIAINKDEHAPIFSACDYGIVGDLNTVLPVLVEKLKA
jgi:electron transfer flavoprotein alpha subunit